MLRSSIAHFRSAQTLAKRSISVSTVCNRDASRIPLSEPISNLAVAPSINKASPEVARETRMTRLPNGLRVCSEPGYGDFVTLGVAVDAGSRYENGFPSGVSRVVEKLAFSSSRDFPTQDNLNEVLVESSGIIDCQSTRDTFMYAASCHREGVDSVVNVLANSVWKPLIHDDDVKYAQECIKYENDELPKRIEALDMYLPDYIHQAAFQHNTLGNPKLTPLEKESKISSKHVYSFLMRYHSPERMVIGGIGVNHDEFVKSVEKHFDMEQTAWAEMPEILMPNVPEVDKSVAQYTGGELRKSFDLMPLTIGKPYPLLAHVVLGFEGCSFKDDDFVAFCVLQSLLGGGGAFSAGGPGKGMYARMYTDVMNRNHWIYSAVAHNHSYSDTGLFTLTASCPPEGLAHATVILLDQVLHLLKGTDRQELERAKTQLRSHLMMNLEVRPVLFEDMVRQVLGHDERKRPEEYAQKITKVTNSDIVRVAERMLASKPSLVGYGDIKKLPKYNDLDRAVATRSLKPFNI